MAVGDDDMEEGEDVDAKITVYHTTGKRKECLRGKVLESRYPIYECHASCACSEDCINRVVVRGRKIPLQIFKTDNGRGWGLVSFLSMRIGMLMDFCRCTLTSTYQTRPIC